MADDDVEELDEASEDLLPLWAEEERLGEPERGDGVCGRERCALLRRVASEVVSSLSPPEVKPGNEREGEGITMCFCPQK